MNPPRPVPPTESLAAPASYECRGCGYRITPGSACLCAPTIATFTVPDPLPEPAPPPDALTPTEAGLLSAWGSDPIAPLALVPASPVAAEPPRVRTGPVVVRADGTRVTYAQGYDPKAAAYEESRKSGQKCKPARRTRPVSVAGVPCNVKITLTELWDYLTKSAAEWRRNGDPEQAARVLAYRDLVFAGPDGEVTP